MSTNDARTPEGQAPSHAALEQTDSGTPAVDMLQEVYEEQPDSQATPPESIIAKLEIYLGKRPETQG